MKAIAAALLFSFLIVEAPNAEAFVGQGIREGAGKVLEKLRFTRTGPVVQPQDTVSVESLARQLADPEQSRHARRQIGNMQLSEAERGRLFTDIAVEQSKMTRREGDELIKNLGNVEGFASTVSKVVGRNSNQTQGHLAELRIANYSHKDRLEVVAIGRRFNDGVKRGATDLDLKLRHANQDVLVEVKNYGAGKMPPMDIVRADMTSLRSYKRQYSENAIKVFTVNTKPSRPEDLRRLERAATSNNVCLAFGRPEQVAVAVKILMQRGGCR